MNNIHSQVLYVINVPKYREKLFSKILTSSLCSEVMTRLPPETHTFVCDSGGQKSFPQNYLYLLERNRYGLKTLNLNENIGKKWAKTFISSQIMIFLCRFCGSTPLQHLSNLIRQGFLYMHSESLNGLVHLDQQLDATLHKK